MFAIGPILDARKLHISSLFYISLIEEPEVYFSFPCTSFGNKIYNLNMSSRPWYKKGL